MRRTLPLSLLAGGVIAANWLRLERPREDVWRAAALVALAVLPGVVRRMRLRILAALGAALAGISIAFFVPLLALRPGGAHFFGPIVSRFRSGFVDFYAFRLPIDPAFHPHMHMILLVSTFAFTLCVALAVAARRPILAVACFLVGAGWPATLLAGGNELGRGVVILVAALAILAGLSERAGRFAAPAIAAVVLGAVALSASPAVAKPGFLAWQHWNPYGRAQKPVSVSYVWNGNYTGITFPHKVTTVFTVRAPQSIGTYWRATVLDAYVNDRWTEHVWHETPLESHELVPPIADDVSRRVQQEITIGALKDNHLIAASMPAAFNVSEPASFIGQNVALATDGLKRGEEYLAWSYLPEPTAGQLVRSPAVYPRALTRPGRDLELAPGVTSPPFGDRGREALLASRLTGALSPYRALFERARSVVGNTHSPYAAMVALERWLRTTGGFVYSLHPPLTPGVPPLVGFALQTKTGYCQHFAGAMALMARLLGVPARVAAGFVSGHYANGRWTVTDHDAHTWVEVWFRGFGWLPFDPTPGRGRLAAPYSAASLGFNVAAESKLLSKVVRGGEVFGLTGTPKRGTNLHSAADVGVRGLGGTRVKTHHHSLGRFLAELALALVIAIATAKFLRRRLRYLTRDPRKIAAACAHELADFLADQRFPISRTATFGELGEAVADRLAVDARTFAEAADAARFGPPGSSADAAARAKSELRDLKRRLRRELFLLDRARGVVSLRSLGFS